MLVRLITARQVVLLCGGDQVFLFYHGEVYRRSMPFGLSYLPRHREGRSWPIWTLIDMEKGSSPTGNSSNIWPVQVTSPNFCNWKGWFKQWDGTMLGMPKWNVEELMEWCVSGSFFLPVVNPSHIVH